MRAMTDAQYGQQVREREAFYRRVTKLITGRDNRAHSMAVQRKAGHGVGHFADITKPMPAEKLTFVRQRALRTAKEAIQRQWILSNPFAAIRKRII